MNRRFDLIVFDWDGTLMDSADAIVRSIRAASRDAGLPEPSVSASRHIIGLGLIEAMRHLFPDAREEDWTRLADRYRHHYFQASDDIALFEGARETVEALGEAGYLLAVATGKGRRGLDAAFEFSGIGRHFHASRCADESFSKPNPAMLFDLMERLGAQPSRTLMIGDTTHDLLMAENAGVKSVALCHGAHERQVLEALSPLACLEDFAELRAWLPV